jgi:hypothetical protein
VFYLGVGVLAGERLTWWLGGLEKQAWQTLFLQGFQGFHLYNPFGVLEYWLENYGQSPGESLFAWQQLAWLEAAALAALGLLAARAAGRLKGHFHERHYRPAVGQAAAASGRLGNRPLSWWAVRRVMEYSGRVNLWLAGGFGVLYALYHVAAASNAWPDWLGRRVFQIVDRAGGVPAVTTGLVVLAAVPAAFQYGLWDSNAHERCRRLELLLLTNLGARDYWEAAAAAAWRRGRGYFGVAVLLWLAEVLAQPAGGGRVTDRLVQVTGALAAGVIVWGFYFAAGFRAFAQGLHANHLGLLLTVGLPAWVIALSTAGQPALAALLPPGFVYSATAAPPVLAGLAGPVLAGAAALALAQTAQARCESDLRAWYERHHGRKLLD